VYRQKVEQLTDALNADETTRHEAVEIIRGMVNAIRLTPDSHGELEIKLVGELAGIISLGEEAKNKSGQSDRAHSISMVAGTGFEPVTFRL
jgi:site-specific DNA recombinase